MGKPVGYGEETAAISDLGKHATYGWSKSPPLPTHLFFQDGGWNERTGDFLNIMFVVVFSLLVTVHQIYFSKFKFLQITFMIVF